MVSLIIHIYIYIYIYIYILDRLLILAHLRINNVKLWVVRFYPTLYLKSFVIFAQHFCVKNTIKILQIKNIVRLKFISSARYFYFVCVRKYINYNGEFLVNYNKMCTKSEIWTMDNASKKDLDQAKDSMDRGGGGGLENVTQALLIKTLDNVVEWWSNLCHRKIRFNLIIFNVLR